MANGAPAQAWVVMMRPEATAQETGRVVQAVEDMGTMPYVSRGDRAVIGVMPKDDRTVDVAPLARMAGVETVMPLTTPYRLTSRIMHPNPTEIRVGEAMIGGGAGCLFMAGPCAVESYEQTLATARAVRSAGARVLRGGAFKPRTSPYSFQGLGAEGLEILAAVKKETGLPVVTELMDAHHLDALVRVADIIQIGARNMQNFPLLEAVGKQEKPILLKRGMMATLEEWVMAAEYIMGQGNRQVILCERGIRTFETSTRNTMDVAAVPYVRSVSHLPVVVDPSQASGRRDFVIPLALAGVAAGADGLLVEVHPDPDHALSDGPQQLTFAQFEELTRAVRVLDGALKPR